MGKNGYLAEVGPILLVRPVVSRAAPLVGKTKGSVVVVVVAATVVCGISSVSLSAVSSVVTGAIKIFFITMP